MIKRKKNRRRQEMPSITKTQFCIRMFGSAVLFLGVGQFLFGCASTQKQLKTTTTTKHFKGMTVTEVTEVDTTTFAIQQLGKVALILAERTGGSDKHESSMPTAEQIMGINNRLATVEEDHSAMRKQLEMITEEPKTHWK